MKNRGRPRGGTAAVANKFCSIENFLRKISTNALGAHVRRRANRHSRNVHRMQRTNAHIRTRQQWWLSGQLPWQPPVAGFSRATSHTHPPTTCPSGGVPCKRPWPARVIRGGRVLSLVSTARTPRCKISTRSAAFGGGVRHPHRGFHCAACSTWFWHSTCRRNLMTI